HGRGVKPGTSTIERILYATKGVEAITSLGGCHNEAGLTRSLLAPCSVRAQILNDGLGSRTDLEFAINAPHMFARCIEADAEAMGDLFVEPAFSEAVKHLAFADGQLIETQRLLDSLKLA